MNSYDFEKKTGLFLKKYSHEIKNRMLSLSSTFQYLEQLLPESEKSLINLYGENITELREILFLLIELNRTEEDPPQTIEKNISIVDLFDRICEGGSDSKRHLFIHPNYGEYGIYELKNPCIGFNRIFELFLQIHTCKVENENFQLQIQQSNEQGFWSVTCLSENNEKRKIKEPELTNSLKVELYSEIINSQLMKINGAMEDSNGNLQIRLPIELFVSKKNKKLHSGLELYFYKLHKFIYNTITSLLPGSESIIIEDLSIKSFLEETSKKKCLFFQELCYNEVNEVIKKIEGSKIMPICVKENLKSADRKLPEGFQSLTVPVRHESLHTIFPGIS